MIELPRAVLIADEIAREAEFFSFGTNDLTQATFGFSRDDAGKFIKIYLEKKILENDPFQTLDQQGVGELMRIAGEILSLPIMESRARRNTISRVSLSILGTLLIVLAILTYYTYRQEIRAAQDRVSSGSQVVNTACGPIEYAAGGKGIPVLMIHGAGGGFDQGLEIGRPLIDNGFQLIAVSRFGYLRTPFPADASPVAQADAHACLLDALNLQRVVIIGLSAGAPSAMQLCLRHPERCRAMVLLVPLAFLLRPARYGWKFRTK